jgi:cytochrome bd-type quinol oxidase subunit 2
MQQSRSRVIARVAIAQFVPLVVLPWPLTMGSLVLVASVALLCVFLGWGLFRHKAWARTLTIFVQGFNIIVRIITLFPNVYTPETGLDAALLISYAIAIPLSWVVLRSIDKPEVQLVFES